MLRRILIALACAVPLLAGASPMAAQTAADSAAIRQAALNYIEGWYTSDGGRMSSALHAGLVKRIVRGAELSEMTSGQLVAATTSGTGRQAGRKDVAILSIFGNAASVRLDAQDFVDFMHIARINGEWKIVNVLWDVRRR
jgi:hypothetical protein